MSALPDSGQKRPSRAARLVVSLERRADRPWFLPAVSIFPLSDYVLPFLPNQMLLLGLSVVLPRRWWQLALAFVLATGLGALLTAFAIQEWGQPLLERLFGGGPESRTVAEVMTAIERYGLVALVGLAMLPWPPRTAVIVCAIAGLSVISIGVAVAAGRIVPAAAYTLIGARAPGLLRGWRRIDDLLTEIDAVRPVAVVRKSS
ncbi:VTT domain-containing protein [Wenzhouxiangella sp. XN24]|uniref:VTT domain-containing protein n=1 Tax=Wenzhouxiangella sp. XN24 TaxID=2713569 RepID=UPI0013ED8E54|nr:VTT domain-containing protein [Wenzhouxiangella sp. XN24]NGX16370.1 VTT domain-containing protein [Wenzhouxiangella sp. XN24]